MDIVPFLRPQRLKLKYEKIITDHEYALNIVMLNLPLAYSIYYSFFDINIFLFSYVITGFMQGCVTSLLYKICDRMFTKPNVDEWIKTSFYDNVILNYDSAYLYAIGSSVYTCLLCLPSKFLWTFHIESVNVLSIQLILLFLLHDIFFYIVHYIIHKVPLLRKIHYSIHHKCPLHIGSSRCTYSSSGLEALSRDLYTLIIPTMIISYYYYPFNAYIWIPYYTFYTFWSFYIHTGINEYHNLHHSKISNRNYGLYYISDYIFGTLEFK